MTPISPETHGNCVPTVAPLDGGVGATSAPGERTVSRSQGLAGPADERSPLGGALKAVAPHLSLEEVRKLFMVDDNGQLRWSHDAAVRSEQRGELAGILRPGRHAPQVKVKGRRLDVRRLAHFHSTGEWLERRVIERVWGVAGSPGPVAFADLTVELLSMAVAYDGDKGSFTYAAGRQKAGQPIGWVASNGYLTVHACGHNLLAHRVAFFLMEGRWPVAIDHINRDRLDNRWANLRECTLAENTQNRADRAKGNDLPRGVRREPRGRYGAQIVANGKSHYLGTFATAEEAAAAYVAARERLHPFFARLAS